MVQGEQGGWVTIGVRQLCVAEAMGRKGIAWAAVGGQGLLQTLVRDKSHSVVRRLAHQNDDRGTPTRNQCSQCSGHSPSTRDGRDGRP